MSNSQQKVLNYEGLQYLYTGLNSIFAKKDTLSQLQGSIQSTQTSLAGTQENVTTIQNTLTDYAKYITIAENAATFTGDLTGTASKASSISVQSATGSSGSYYFLTTNSSTASTSTIPKSPARFYFSQSTAPSSSSSTYDTLTIGTAGSSSSSSSTYYPLARIYLRNGRGGGNYIVANSAYTSASYTITLPSKSGTLALTSNVTEVSNDLADLSSTVQANTAKLSGIAENAEVNQNAFSSFLVGSTTLNASSKTDALTFVAGDNVTLNLNSADKTLTITATTPPTTIDSTLTLSGAAADAKATGDKITAATSAMNTALENYVLSSTLTSTLGNYVTNTSLNSTLGSYAKASDLNTLDSKVTNIIGGVTEAELNTLKELSDALNNDANFATSVLKDLADIDLDIQALNTSVDGKAPTSHASTATTYGAASASYYGHAMASSTTPKANGTAALGSETAKFARGDHVHPAQTTVSGNAGTATKFQSAQSVALTGDVTGTSSSQAGWSVSTTLASSGVTAGSYGPSSNASPAHSGTFSVPYFTVDSKGRVTAASTKTITLPADNNSDTKVTQAAAITTDGAYPILLGYSTSTGNLTNTVNKASTLTYNPGTGLLYTSHLMVGGRAFNNEITCANTTTAEFVKICTITKQSTPSQGYSTVKLDIINQGNPRTGRINAYFNSTNSTWSVSTENDPGTVKVLASGSTVTICIQAASAPTKITVLNMYYDPTYYSIAFHSGQVVDTTDYDNTSYLYNYNLNRWIYCSESSPTSSAGYVSNYYPVLQSDTNYQKYYNPNIIFQGHNGTTSQDGYFNLILGNNTASGTANNMFGQLRLYGIGTGFFSLRGINTSTSSNYTSYLPDASGTLLNTGNYTSYVVPKSGGTFTGNISIQDTYYPTAKFYPTYNSSGFYGQLEADYNGYMQLWANDSSTNRRGLAIYGPSATANAAEAIKLRYATEGVYGSSLVYTEQNIIASTEQPSNPVKGMIWLELEA